MQASETKLQQIIEGTKQYVVPLFQRPYSWKKSEWQVLWNDLLELCNADNPRPHFMGSIVTMSTKSVPEGITKYLLIDGQQRLTTVFILLCALRDIAKLQDNDLAEEIDNTILVNPYKKDSDYFKLQPTQIDREAFHRIISSKSLVKESGISECYQFFYKKFKSRSSLQSQRIKKVICSNLSLVSVVLNDDDDPYLVFESLNAKGRPLTQADLIRNYFFMRIHSDSQESVYGQYWLPMQNLLNDNLTEFIRHYLTKTGIEVKQSEVYFEIKDRIGSNDALAYLKDLFNFAIYYSKLLNPEREPNKIISKYLSRLNRLELATVYPFLLNCYDDWMTNRITEEENLISDKSDIPILNDIKNMSKEEMESYSKYRIVDFKHYMKIQKVWLETEKWLLGIKVNHAPSESEFVEDPYLVSNATRYRVFYVLKYPDKVI